MLVEEFQPCDLDMPLRFERWRAGQFGAIKDAIDCVTRFSGHCISCGQGKSLTAVAIARILGGRTLILTPFKGLQTQLTSEFNFITDLRGKASYNCPRLRTNCEFGAPRCDARAGALGNLMCLHKLALQQATSAQIVVSNYSCWFHQMYGTGIGEFDTLILDEADEAEGALSSFMAFNLTAREALGDLSYKRAPAWDATVDQWSGWALTVKSRLRSDMNEAEREAKLHDSHDFLEHFFYLRNLFRKIETLSTMKADYWVPEVTKEGVKFDPIWPGKSAEKYLFRGIKRVLLFSGTLNKKTLEVLSIRKDESTFFDYPSPFHPARNPLILVPTGMFKYPVSDELIDSTIETFDRLVDQRLDRKGILHTVSFKHLEQFADRSRHKKLFISNDITYAHGNRMTADVVEVFKKAPPPAILATPSVATGYDFPEEFARYQALIKTPFPDTTSAVSQKRKKLDPEYYNNETMRTVVQACSRSCRSVYDFCETWCFDSRLGGFLLRNKHLAPKWFLGNNGAWRFRKMAEGVLPPPMRSD